MLENPTPPSSQSQPQAAQPDTANVVRRYAPPNQRNRPLNRRKSADRFDRSSFHGNDVEKNPVSSSKNVSVADHGDVGSHGLLNENPQARLIALKGCSNSEASQLLSERWEAAMQALNDPSIDLSERPVLYSGSGASAWETFRFPHQFMMTAESAGSPGSQMDFLAELRRAMSNANADFDA